MQVHWRNENAHTDEENMRDHWWRKNDEEKELPGKSALHLSGNYLVFIQFDL